MTFRVTVPPGSLFADPNVVDRDTPLDFNDDDAFAFLPGGVLGIWDDSESRVTFIPAGGWSHVSGVGRQPGVPKGSVNPVKNLEQWTSM